MGIVGIVVDVLDIRAIRFIDLRKVVVLVAVGPGAEGGGNLRQFAVGIGKGESVAEVIGNRGEQIASVGVGSRIVVSIGDAEQTAAAVVLPDGAAGFLQLIAGRICRDDPFLAGLIDPVAAAVILEGDIPATFLHQADSACLNNQPFGEGRRPAIAQSASRGALAVIGSGEGEGSPWPGEAGIGCREVFVAGAEVDLVGGDVRRAGGVGDS